MPNWLLFGIMAVAFTFVLATAQTAYWWYIARQEKMQEELLRRIAGGTTEDGRLESLIRESEGDAAAQALGGLGATMQEFITSADAGITVSNLVTQMAVAAAAGALGGFFILGPVGLIGALPAGYVPYFVLQLRASRRSAHLVEQLPDALDLMARALQAGVGLSDAFRLAAEELAPPLSIEFSRVFEEIRFGRDYREAFTTMIKRNPKVFDMRLMVSSILLARETGGNLIEILENIADTIRSRFTFFAKVQAMTSEARFTALILGSLPLGVIIILNVMSPDYMTVMLEDPVGKIMSVACVLVYMTGIMVMRDMSKVEV